LNINATLLGQMLTFALLVWVTMKYIWPPVLKALEERQQKIAEGLHAAERSKLELADTLARVEQQLAAAKRQSDILLKQAAQRAEQIVEEAKQKAKHENERIVASAQIEIRQEIEKAKTQLFKEVADIAIKAAEHILQKNIQPDVDAALFNKFIQDASEN
jgi:F-type H+-transporting ATPase subunit b